ncbi:MAG: hypothetical protein HUJ24_00820 [Rhodobacteraceae bacterium]|nr:hypothetical protein [Paracoccaceae bacterium]
MNFTSDPATLSTKAHTILDIPAFKNETLGLWLFAYIGLIDTICAGTLTAGRCRRAGKADVVFNGLGGRIALGLHLDMDATGAATDFEISTLSAEPHLRNLAHLRFDLDETDNPLIGLTHSLLQLVELQRAPILTALNRAAAPSA